jgi:hypothetical protein
MSVYSDFVLALGPRGYWRLNDASGNPQDASGNGYHMTSATNLSYSQTGALINDSDKAVAWNGSSSYSLIPSACLNPDYNSDFTIVFWVMTTSNTLNDIIMEKWGAGDTRVPFNIKENGDGTLKCSRWDGTYSPECYTGQMEDGAWHFVVYRKSGSELRALTDATLGVAATDTCVAAMTNTATVRVGIKSGSTNLWAGTMDEIAYFNKALTWDQCTTMYSLGKSLWIPRRPKLVVCPSSYHIPRLAQ